MTANLDHAAISHGNSSRVMFAKRVSRMSGLIIMRLFAKFNGGRQGLARVVRNGNTAMGARCISDQALVAFAHAFSENGNLP